MQSLKASCPPQSVSAMSAVEAATPNEHKSAVTDVIRAGLAAGVPWGALLAYVSANLTTILAMLTGGVSIPAIIQLIIGAFKIVIPPTPTP